MKKIFSLVLTLSMMLCLFACEKSPDNVFSTAEASEIPMTTQAVTDEETSCFHQSRPMMEGNIPHFLKTAVADFGFDLFKEAVKSETNALISPVSVIMALAMTANGADGKTLEQTESVLGAEIESFNIYFTKDVFSGDGINLANSVWLNNQKNRLTVNQDFINSVKSSYGAEVFSRRFDNDTLTEINRWVSRNTNGSIENMLSEIPADAVIYLINTILFDAEWEYPYTAGNISEYQAFTSESGEKQLVTMLRSTESSCKYFTLGKTEGIIRHYTNGYSFAAILPNEGISINEALESFDSAQFVETVVPLRYNPTCATGLYPVYVSLPKFEFESSFRLSDALSEMGMPLAFSGKADFSRMASSKRGNICIGEVYHNSFISLSENGTKAGAATDVMINDTAEAEIFQSKTLEFNRPFIYVIYRTENGLPLFIGTVRDFDS